MPEMQSPDGAETLRIPDEGLAAMLALGWHEVGTRIGRGQPETSEPKPRRSRSRRSTAEVEDG